MKETIESKVIKMEDTIVAVSTAMGIGAISIVRVSGEDSINIVNKIFKGKNLGKVPTHTINYGHILDSDTVVDEVLVMLMRKPRTYTMEDIVEINCHGGIATTNKVLELLLSNGCRLAEPGEFTKRAFLNGRIDLNQAEGVMDLIDAKTDQTRKMAINNVTGNVTNLIKNLRQKIIEVLANIEVNIDYPEYDDVEELTVNKVIPLISEIDSEINHILKESKNGQLIKNGIKTSIIGRPNVGKSSILNTLLEEEKAIVTSIAGTTRDTVEGTITLDGLILNMIDTAGIRKTDDIVEQLGVEKSKNLINESDLILFVLNNNEVINDEDKDILKSLEAKNHIVIVNKIDLASKIDKNYLLNHSVIYMSTVDNQGLEELKKEIKKIFNLEKINTGDFTYLTNARGIGLLMEAKRSLEDVLAGIKNNMPIDMIEIDIKEIWNLLGKVIGEAYEEELINQLFSQFCLGK